MLVERMRSKAYRLLIEVKEIGGAIQQGFPKFSGRDPKNNGARELGPHFYRSCLEHAHIQTHYSHGRLVKQIEYTYLIYFNCSLVILHGHSRNY